MTRKALDDEAPSAPPRVGETVLVVEDDPRVRRLTFDAFTALGYSVLEAADAATAMQMLGQRCDIDMVFSDVVMPGGMSGLDLARRVRELYPRLRIILTTGYSAELANGDGEDLDVQILRKPYWRADLVRALRKENSG